MSESGERLLKCHNCGANNWSIKWKWKNKNERLALTFGHSGMGFQFNDAEFKCNKCGKVFE